jgi:ABC-type nickel/cobalt efflux system permease component RcnA
MSAKLLSFYKHEHNIEFQQNKMVKQHHQSTLINEHEHEHEHDQNQDENAFYVLGYN